jgi:hypothetical protein
MNRPIDPRIQVAVEQFRERMQVQSEAYQDAAALLAALRMVKDMEALYASDGPAGSHSPTEPLSLRLRKWLGLRVPPSTTNSGRNSAVIEGVILGPARPTPSSEDPDPQPGTGSGTSTADDVLREEGRPPLDDR